MMITYYFVNRYFDSKELDEVNLNIEESSELSAPLIYAVIPVLPIIYISFSSIFNFFQSQLS
ncbi:MAG: hypothetical protein CM15mP59_0150 [Flavobacteriaceae bacterium]|nr:MAG: hypothetical protein CM15mP59_0150 [Flavobacteriaceae bacterium]